MKNIPSWLNALLASVFGLVIALAGSSPNHATNLLPHANKLAAISNQQLQSAYAKLPLSFEANWGQSDNSVKFLSKGSGYNLFLTATEAVLALSKPPDKSSAISHQPAVKPQPTANTSTSVVRMQLVESNQQPKVIGLEPLPGVVNYILGNNPKHWQRNIPTYAKVQYQQVYPGVDMVYYGNQGLLEYDFVMAPGADPNMIRMALQGVEKLEVNHQQELVLHTADGKVLLHQPLAYQQVNGFKKTIASHYVLKGKNQVSFEVANYDRSQPLIIDPVLSYSTYLNGSFTAGGDSIAVDSTGNAYVTGSTESPDFPTQNPFQSTLRGFNTFVTKLNPTGSALVYSTYLGGSGSDIGYSIAVDGVGNAYITGQTTSTDFPTQNPLQAAKGGSSEAFVTKLNVTGDALVYSTYLGGRISTFGSATNVGRGIAVDRVGNAYVTGTTTATNFPTQNPFQAALALSSVPGVAPTDAFVTKLNPTGSALVYSTYLGGSKRESGYSIAVDKQAGNAYVTGYTESNDFPTQYPFQAALGGSDDAFVTELDPTGALIYSTYLGGSGGEFSYSIAVDRTGNAYVTGATGSTNFPTQNPFQAALSGSTNAFVTKLNPTGSALVYSTYLGGSGRSLGIRGSGGDIGNSIAVDRVGNAYVTGQTTSTDFPTQNAFQADAFDGVYHAFVTKLDATGSALVYSTYLGGAGTDIGSSIAVDRAGNAYVTGATTSTDFPTQNPFQPDLVGSTDAFVTKLTP